MIVGIIGNGGLGREVKSYLDRIGIDNTYFVSDSFYKETRGVQKLSDFDPNKYQALICIADVLVKESIVNTLPSDTTYFTFIHSSAQIYTDIEIGHGSIIAPHTVITTDAKIGNHVLINYGVTIGHDTYIGDYCTVNPNASVSGNCILDEGVFIGAGSTIREKTKIKTGVVIGMGSVVVKDISEPGTYIGVPAKELNK